MNAEMLAKLKTLRREIDEAIFEHGLEQKSDKERLEVLDNEISRYLNDPKTVDRTIIKTILSLNSRLEKLEQNGRSDQ